MNKPLIVFDWNGTLLSDTRAAWAAGNECLKFYGAKPLSLAEYQEHFTFPIIHFYHKCGLSTDKVLEKQDEAKDVFQNAYDHNTRNARTRRGAKDLLIWLKQQSIPAIILSNAQTDNIKTHVKRLGLEPYFIDINGHNCDGHTVIHTTTKHERLETYMKQHGYAPENTIIIGDSHEEPALAKALGLTSIGITEGCISPKRLRKAAPDHIITSLSEIKSIITEILLDKQHRFTL